MLTASEIVAQLKALESQSTKRIHANHGAREPFFGIKVEDLKKIQKQVKKDYALSKELYDTGISDAMYLAGLIADEKKMTKADLQAWAEKAYWYMLSEYTVAWIAAESNHGWELALEWIRSEKENVATAGWATLSSLVAIKPDAQLDIPALSRLLQEVADTVHQAPNRVRYTMNGFVICVGCYIEALTGEALDVAARIGKVHVEQGGTACKVPTPVDYILKVKNMGRIGKKKKMARC